MVGGEVNRRLAAIVAADVAGYSRLVSSDEEGTLAALRAHRSELIDPKIAEYGGRIANTAGDSVLIEFPSVVDALRCCIDIQRGMAERNADIHEERRITFRVGINVGDVVEQDGDLLGDGVNVAARLEGLAEPGGICLSRTARDQIRDRQVVALEDMGEVEVKNIARPVRVFRVLGEGEAAPTPTRKSASWRTYAAAAFIVFAMFTGGSVWWWNQADRTTSIVSGNGALTLPDKPSIAVLPFVNMSGDQEQEYFSDGMTADLITDLSKVSALIVIARSSSFAYKGKVDDIRRIANELNVRYVIEGSVRKAGGKVRITAQLIEAATGKNLWAERYDRNFREIFDLQDEVLEKIVAALAVTLTPVEKKYLARPLTTSPDAYDLYLKGLQQGSYFTKDSNLRTRKLFEQAIELDPGFATAYANLAQAYSDAAVNSWSVERAADLKQALDLAQKAVALDPALPFGRWSLSRVFSNMKINDRAITEMEKAIELDPNYASAFAYMTYLYVRTGRAEEGLPIIDKAMRLNPRFPFWYLHALAATQFSLARFEAAAANLEKAVERNPNATWVRSLLVAAYAHMGSQDNAEWQIEELRAQGFNKSINDILETSTLQFPAYKKLYADGLRKAGLK